LTAGDREHFRVPAADAPVFCSGERQACPLNGGAAAADWSPDSGISIRTLESQGFLSDEQLAADNGRCIGRGHRRCEIRSDESDLALVAPLPRCGGSRLDAVIPRRTLRSSLLNNRHRQYLRVSAFEKNILAALQFLWRWPASPAIATTSLATIRLGLSSTTS